MTTAPTPAPPASPERPDLATVETKPDIVEVLTNARQESAPPRFVLISPTDRDLAITTIQALREMNRTHCDDERRMLAAEAALRSAIKVADEARDEWDKAPSGMRAGKLLIALSGRLPGYRADIDAIHAALIRPANLLPDAPPTATDAQQTERAS